MYPLILATVLFMPPPAWIEKDPMPPPAKPTGIIDTIRQVKVLVAKGNALADRGKAILDAADRDGKITVDVRLPKVRAVAGPVIVEKPPPLPPLFEPGPEPEVQLVKPPSPPIVVRLPGPRNLFRCPHCGDTESGCDMFLGEELLKMGIKREYLNKITYRQWGVLYDNTINSRKPATAQSGCVGGTCPVPSRRYLFRPWRR